MSLIFDHACSECFCKTFEGHDDVECTWLLARHQLGSDDPQGRAPFSIGGSQEPAADSLRCRLRRSSSRGCKRCELYLGLLRHLGSPNDDDASVLDESPYENTRLNWSPSRCSMSGVDLSTIAGFDARPQGLGADFVLYLSNPDGPNPYGLPPGNTCGNMPGSTSSEATFAKIRHWIADCTETHQCGKAISGLEPGATAFCPNRLLDLRGGKVRLVVNGTATHQAHGRRYACLSHCWGPPAKLIRTTHATIQRFQDNIPFDALTKTFQDAVDISRRLQIDFLWIDSLCIIQDSEQDWRAQSARMVDIYENAFLTIFAARARESSEGCYADYSHISPATTAGEDATRTKNPRLDSLHLGQPIPGLENVSVRRYDREIEMYPYFAGAFPIGSSSTSTNWPLFTRAWVFQEFRLSRRKLLFGSTGVFWHCGAQIIFEAGEPGLADANKHENDAKQHMHATTEAARNHHQWNWHRTVSAYSAMALTFETDRLVALAGIVKRTRAVRPPGDRYLAGLWESTLLTDLAWSALHGIKRAHSVVTLGSGSTGRMIAPDRRGVQPPSFSWASGNSTSCCVYLDRSAPLGTVTVLRVDYSTAEPDEDLGEAAADTEPSITLQSPAFSVRLVLKPEQGMYFGAYGSHYALDHVSKGEVVAAVGSFPGSQLAALFVNATVLPDYGFDAPGEEGVPLGSELLALPMVAGYYSPTDRMWGYRPCVVGILLREKPDGRYERVASFRTAYCHQIQVQVATSVLDVWEFVQWLKEAPQRTVTIV